MIVPPAQNSDGLLAAAVARIHEGAYAAAETALRAVLAENPRHPVAIYLLGISAMERADFSGAENLFRQALSIAPDQPRVALQLAKTLLAQHRPGEAEAQLRSALALPTPDAAMRATLEHQLGLALKRQQKYDDALTLMRAAAARRPAGREEILEQANVLRHLGRPDQAAALYDAILADEPQDMAVHLLRSELRGDCRPDFTASYDAALVRAPLAAGLPIAKGHLLLKARRPQEAEAAFRLALRIASDHPAALAGLGRALESLNDGKGARAAHAKSVRVAPQNGEALQAYAGFLLRQGDTEEAATMAETAWRLEPADQGALALVELCWRARGDAREEWLNDYDRDVAAFDLEPPEGYRDMNSFNRDLAHQLGQLHTRAQQYPTQTLRGGTQTHDDLFYNGHPLADRLLPRINDAVRSYVAGWRTGADLPFNLRRTGGFRYAGSWSSRLADSGFHVNHFHHKGWISSCYYVAVPDIAAEQPQGWIKFGEPPDEFRNGSRGRFGDAFTPRRAIQPRPGRLVLFPSYMWHGTVPFHSPQTRITIAFDAVPA